MKKPRRTVLKTLGTLAVGALVPTFTKLPIKAFSTLSSKQSNPSPSKAILIGAGNRGNRFGKYALANPHQLEMVGVADAENPMRAELFAKAHGISNANAALAEDLLKKPKFADIVILTEQVANPSLAIAALKAGYQVWMDQAFISPSIEREVVAFAQQSNGSVKVVHVINKAILDFHQDQSFIQKQAIFSANFQAGSYPGFLVLG